MEHCKIEVKSFRESLLQSAKWDEARIKANKDRGFFLGLGILEEGFMEEDLWTIFKKGVDYFPEGNDLEGEFHFQRNLSVFLFSVFRKLRVVLISIDLTESEATGFFWIE